MDRGRKSPGPNVNLRERVRGENCLLRQARLQAQKTAIIVAAVDRSKTALAVLSAAGYQATAADGQISITDHAGDPARINSILVHGGIAVSRYRRAAEESREVLDITDVILLDLLREMMRRHVFDHALAQWAGGLVDHGDDSCLTWVANPLILRRDEPSR